MKFLTIQALVAALCLTQPLSQAATLPELIEGVLSTHPSIRSQKALGASAKEAVEGAKWQFYPTPSIGFEQVDASHTDPSYPSYGDKNVTTLRLQQPLWTGGRLSAGLSKAEAGVAVSQATEDGVRQDLALRVVQVYADWYGALLKRQAFEKSLKAHQTLREQIERRIANGISPQSDLSLLLGRQQQTDADLASARAQEQSALGRLTQLLGRALQPQALAADLSAPQELGGRTQDLLDYAQAQNPGVRKLQAQALIAEAEIAERKSELLPEVYLRAERQYGNYSYPNQPAQNRFFVGVNSHFGAGLSSLSQVSGAQARLEAAQADIDSTRVSLGEQIQADYAQAESGQVRLGALLASLASADSIARAWGRQFIAGRKTWLDVMNEVREQAQLEAQIADARSAQLLVTWRLAISGRGLDSVLLAGAPAPAASSEPVAARPDTAAPGNSGWSAVDAIPLYAQDPAEALDLHMAQGLDPLRLGVETGGLAPTAAPGPNDNHKEATW